MNTIQLKQNENTSKIPTKGSSSSAGHDLYASQSFTIPPGTTVQIPTGISIAIPEGYFGGIFARSGLATKQGLRPANCVGIIDSDYRGEIIVPLYNDSKESKIINIYDRIAQLIIIPYYIFDWEIVKTLSSTKRGDGGFGSTGV